MKLTWILKRMKNKVLILLLLVCQGTALWAQRPVRDRIKTLKVAFITERLALTSQEAQTFWPVYNAHAEAMQTIRKKERTELKSKIPVLQDLSAQQSSKLLDQYVSIQKAKHEAELAYMQELEKVLSPKKILLLLQAEEDFKKRLLQQYRKRKAGG